MINCAISLKFMISLPLPYIFNAWPFLHSFTQVPFSIHVSTLNTIKCRDFRQPLGELAFPPRFCQAVVNSGRNSANSQETGECIEKFLRSHVRKALEESLTGLISI